MAGHECMLHQHERGHQLRLLPSWSKPPFHQCAARWVDEHQYFHLALTHLHSLMGSEEVTNLAYRVLGEKPTEDKLKLEEHRRRHLEAIRWAEGQVKQGLPIVHTHAIVSLWSMLEVMVEDVLIAVLANTNESWELKEIQELRIEIGAFWKLEKNDQAALVVDLLSRKLGSPLRTGVGQFDGLLSTFDLMPVLGPELRRCLHELCQIRNSLIHRGGVADSRFLKECPWVLTAAGKRIGFSGNTTEWYFSGVILFLDRLVNKLCETMGLEHCVCEGANELPPRPPVNMSETDPAPESSETESA